MVKNTEEDMDQVEKRMNIVEMLATLGWRVEWLAVAFGDIKGMVGP